MISSVIILLFLSFSSFLVTSLSFLEMYGVGKVEQLNITEKWVNNNPVNSLSVPIGVDQNG